MTKIRCTNGVTGETQGYVDLDEILNEINLAFCDSLIHDFGRCPRENKKGCDGCRFYNDSKD